MPTTKRSRSRKSWWSWWHLVLVLTGGSAGIGGWQGWDYVPTIREALIKSGIVGSESTSEIGAVLARGVKQIAGREGARDAFRKPGTFVVQIKEIRLDSTVFKGGHTVDIQATVVKKGLNGKETDVWESKPFGTRLAVVGRDELATGWPNAPFEVVWTPGDRFVVDVFDRRGFLDAKSFLMEPNADPNVEFPLQPGTHTLTLVERNRSSSDPSASRIMIESHPKSDDKSPTNRTAGTYPPSREPILSTKFRRETASNSNASDSRVIMDRDIQIR